jgi:hypothetical protein
MLRSVGASATPARNDSDNQLDVVARFIGDVAATLTKETAKLDDNNQKQQRAR